MPGFRVISESELRRLIEGLDKLGWPIPIDQKHTVVSAMGWTEQSAFRGKTSLPVNYDLYTLGELSEQVSRVEVRVSDTLNPREKSSKTAVQRELPKLEAAISRILGSDETSKPWAVDGTVWELSDGRQLRLIPGKGSIELQYWAKVRADLDRDQQRLGVDPNRDVADQL